MRSDWGRVWSMLYTSGKLCSARLCSARLYSSSKFICALVSFVMLASAAYSGNSPYSRVREVTPSGATVSVMSAGKPMVSQVSNRSVFDITISIYERQDAPNYPAGDDNADVDAGPSDDEQNAYEDIIRYFADAVCEATNGAHHLGEVRVFKRGRHASKADILWSAVDWPSANTSGFGKNGRRIYFGDVFPMSSPVNALAPEEREAAGYTLAHEWGHYVLGLFDEYEGTSTDVGALTPRKGDEPPPYPSIMNTQWPAANASVANRFRYLNFSQKDNFSAKTVQGRLHGLSGWEILLSSPYTDKKFGKTATAGKFSRVQYTNLANVSPPPANAGSPPNYRIELPAGQNDCRQDLKIIWQQNEMEMVIAVDTSVSMRFGLLSDAVAAAKVLVDIVEKDSSAIGLTHFQTNVFVDQIVRPITKDPGPGVSVRNDLKFALDNFKAEGSTAMFDGAQQALDMLNDYKAANDTNATRMVFLFSDGADTNSKTSTADSILANYQSSLVSLSAFAYGDEAPEALLRRLAQETFGVYRVAPDSLVEIQRAFVRALGKATSYQVIKSKKEYSLAGTLANMSMYVDRTVSKLQMLVSFDRADASDISFAVNGPSGSVPTDFNCTSGAGQTICHGYLNASDTAAAGVGNWNLTVNNQTGTDFPMEMAVLSVPKSGEIYDVTVGTLGENELAYPGPIPVTAAITKGGRAISGVDVELLHITPTGFEISTGSVSMNDQGIDGDATAMDGIYTVLVDYDGGQFSPTIGAHTFEVSVSNAQNKAFFTDVGKSPSHDLPFLGVKHKHSANGKMHTHTTAGTTAGAIGENGDVFEASRTLVGENFERTGSVQIFLTDNNEDNHSNTTTGATLLPDDNSDIKGRIDFAGDVDVFHIANPDTSRDLSIRVFDMALGMEPVLVVTKASDGTELVNGDISTLQSSNGYLVANIAKEDLAGGVFVAVSHEDANAAKGNFSISAGSAIISDTPSLPPALVAAILPSSRSVQTNTTTTFFMTILNGSENPAFDVGVALKGIFPITDFTYQVTDPVTNAVLGEINAPSLIEGGLGQTYVVGFRPFNVISPTQLEFDAPSFNGAGITTIAGVNTLQFRASSSPVIDMVSLAATLNNDGFVDIPGNTGTGVFAVATTNLGIAGTVTARVNTGANAIPVTVSLCQTDALGACMAQPADNLVLNVGVDETPTFGIFVTAQGEIANDPATNRVFVEFVDDADVVVGSTSVAVKTVAPS